MNQRPSGYEPDELPDCSIPHQQICRKHQLNFLDYKLVRKGGLEPPRPKALPPQGSVSTNSTTTAAVTHSSRITEKKKGLIKTIRSFLVQLVKFHSIVQVWSAQTEPIPNYRHSRFVAWLKSPKSDWLRKTVQ